jgi:ATP-dependent 26S proteasome regulatory subunit
MSLRPSRFGCGATHVTFHALPRIGRDQIVLPPAIVDAIDSNVVHFIQKVDALRRMGRPVKRGILFHGRPGTGKTHAARYLAQRCEGVTVFFLTADNLGTLTATCQMARMLEPSLVLIEDVDLIAKERDRNKFVPMLHELLNEMDGVDSGAAVIFVLTTNRPEDLEDALAARPGRVDKAIEFPLPDQGCRRRLFELYGTGLNLDVRDWDGLVRRTQGASPAFIQEVMRRASLAVADPSDRITDDDILSTLREMLVGNDRLTRQILGFVDPEDPLGASN